MANPADHSHERGLALVSVLWALSILSVIAASFLAITRSSHQLEVGSRNRAELQAIAEAGVMRAVLGITDRRADHRWRVDGVPIAFAFAGATLSVRVEDQFGKIDINMADATLLKGLFSATAKVPDLADTLTDRVLDWRENDDLRRARAGNTNDAPTGPGYTPRRGSFQSVDELLLVPGITPQIFARIRPALTVYSQRPAVDVRVASREALLALPTMDENKVSDILARRDRDSATTGNRLPPGIIDPAIPLGGRAFAIKVAVQNQRGAANLDTIVRLTTDLRRPYWILSWQ